jgi:hypothetical protein
VRDTTLDQNGVPKKFRPYFNYHDFRSILSNGRIIIDSPGDKFGFYHELSVDSSTVISLSEKLFKAREPVLSNFYTGNETYRFIWSRAFHYDYFIRISKQGIKHFIHTTKLDKKTHNVESEEKSISLKDFEEFKKVLYNGNFWAMPSYKHVSALDGSNWIIEAHIPIGYKVLYRFKPGLIYEDELVLRQGGEWLIRKSGISQTQRY